LEFESLMDRLNINFSRKKWKQIYHEIDRNYDDQVSFEEFVYFLFPDNNVSKVFFEICSNSHVFHFSQNFTHLDERS
jgi:hypothetical protein